MPVSVRPARRSDHDQMAAVYRDASLSNNGDRAVLLANPQLLIFDPAPVEEGRSLVAVAGDAVVGFVTTRCDGERCELEDMFVTPSWMRRGVATLLMTEAVHAAREKGASVIDVIANGHALAFYGHVGFLHDHEVQLEFGRGYRMHLALRP